MPAFRLDQLLVRFGCGTRRGVRDLVKAGRVTVNGVPVTDAGQRADPAAVMVDGAAFEFPHGLLVAVHKPAGFVCSHDPSERPLIYDLLPPAWLRRHPRPETVGRLDKETSGLILVTDDGPLLHRLTSPRHEVGKTYEVIIDRDLPAGLTGIFASGTLMLHGEAKPCRPARLEVTGARTARLHLHEGKFHQVRRMFASADCTVTRLHRTRIGVLELGDLAEGAWREVTVADVQSQETTEEVT